MCGVCARSSHVTPAYEFHFKGLLIFSKEREKNEVLALLGYSCLDLDLDLDLDSIPI